jgi:hypothetical protein
MATPSVPSPQQIAQELANTLVTISNAKNAAAITNYNQAVTFYTKIYGMQPSASAPPKPTSPEIESVNTDLVIQLDLQSPPVQDSAWLGIYTYSQYVPPIVPPPAIQMPTIVVQPFGTGYEGFFELAPDSPSISPGQTVVISGVTYEKEIIGQSPFAPNGQITAWKVL